MAKGERGGDAAMQRAEGSLAALGMTGFSTRMSGEEKREERCLALLGMTVWEALSASFRLPCLGPGEGLRFRVWRRASPNPPAWLAKGYPSNPFSLRV